LYRLREEYSAQLKNLRLLLKYVIYIIGLILLYFYIINTEMCMVFSDYVRDKLIFYGVIIEDAKGSLEIYIINNGRKKRLKSFPIEVMVVYDRSYYNSKILLLKQLINKENQFIKNIKIELMPHSFQM